MAASWLLASGDIVEIQIRGRLDNQRTINTFHYAYTGTGTDDGDTRVRDILAMFDTTLHAGIATVTGVDQRYEALRGQRIFPTRVVPVDIVPSAVAGAISTQCSPSGASVVIRRSGLISTPHAYGRIFVPGVPMVQIGQSTLIPAARAAWNAAVVPFMNANLVDSAGDVWNPVIYDKASPASSEDVFHAALDPVIRYQRRREVGKGE